MQLSADKALAFGRVEMMGSCRSCGLTRYEALELRVGAIGSAISSDVSEIILRRLSI